MIRPDDSRSDNQKASVRHPETSSGPVRVGVSPSRPANNIRRIRPAMARALKHAKKATFEFAGTFHWGDEASQPMKHNGKRVLVFTATKTGLLPRRPFLESKRPRERPSTSTQTSGESF
jgi:hypothetical protein